MVIVTSKSDKNKGIKIGETWYTVVGRAAEYLNQISAGDDVEIRYSEDKKNVVFIRKTGEQPIERPHQMTEELLDPYKPLGNLYAMVEEKLNETARQNSMNNALLIRICEKLGIDINEIKSAQ